MAILHKSILLIVVDLCNASQALPGGWRSIDCRLWMDTCHESVRQNLWRNGGNPLSANAYPEEDQGVLSPPETSAFFLLHNHLQHTAPALLYILTLTMARERAPVIRGKYVCDYHLGVVSTYADKADRNGYVLDSRTRGPNT
ncbi:uncharacterized protein EV420DRAFT_1131618 [Desarmillaria tabescens]|uniref:Uncharacterized protein n=1 Tax=Armillaria tabescens TaxID=1929756 RepID=A0AA39JEV7_ARMTA|nr:uncharacterized protein EV420DRAFT_1131618 [Desarmillaria tabescens]KAK0440700.1 hypothetical protein EV420DRAFT_1131618 [Desarmillaria tabescens]